MRQSNNYDSENPNPDYYNQQPQCPNQQQYPNQQPQYPEQPAYPNQQPQYPQPLQYPQYPEQPQQPKQPRPKEEPLPSKYERSNSYRTHYLKVHPGLFHEFFLCPYCGRVVFKHSLFDSNKLEIDHIIPIEQVQQGRHFRLFRFIVSSYGNEGVNSVKNLGSACHFCNRKKTDNGGMWIVRGALGRFLFPFVWLLLATFIVVLAILKISLLPYLLFSIFTFFVLLILFSKNPPFTYMPFVIAFILDILGTMYINNNSFSVMIIGGLMSGLGIIQQYALKFLSILLQFLLNGIQTTSVLVKYLIRL
jgi:5-methylcytosine-specific restriction endonuclease McrA